MNKEELPELAAEHPDRQQRVTQTDLYRIRYYEQLVETTRQRLKTLRAENDVEAIIEEVAILRGAQTALRKQKEKLGPML
jgi:hypothetical protein